MFRKFVHFVLLMILLAGGFSLNPVAPVHAAESDKAESVVNTSMLNPDGTLNLNNLPNGALDLSGWDVNLDPARGPVFSPLGSQDNWDEVGHMGPINGNVYTILVDGSDVYVGGSFTNAGGIDEADNIARWDGNAWHSLSHNGSGNGAVQAPVYDILKVVSVFYVAGWFGNVYNSSGGVIDGSSRLAKWDGTAWSSADGDTTSALNGNVSDLAVYSGSSNYLYVAGEFTDANGIAAADKIARLNLDTNTWEALGADSGGDGSIDNWVLSVAVDSNGVVYAGGFFTDADEVTAADRIAKWDSVNDWQAMGNSALNGIVGSIAIDSANNVYAGGNFYDAAGIPEADYIAKWNGSTWSALGGNGAGGGAITTNFSYGGGTVVQELIIAGNILYAVGPLGLANDATADFVVQYNLNTNTWSGLGNNGAGNGSIRGFTSAIYVSGGTVYVGGTFPKVNNGGNLVDASENVARFTSGNWQGLSGENMLSNSYIESIVSSGTEVYVAGHFTRFAGDYIGYIARWDGSAWHSLGNENVYSPALNGAVYDLEIYGSDLYAVGSFTTVNNNGTNVPGGARVAKWDGSTWSALGNGINNGTVYDVEVDGNGNVYVGGSFTNADGNPAADRIAMWNGASWNALASNGAGDGALNGDVYALEVNGTDLYVGGGFTNTLDTSNTAIPNASFLAKWNGSSWSAMPNLSTPLNSSVFTITRSGTDVYIGGQFFNLNGISTADYIAKWDGSAWSALGAGAPGNGALNHQVESIVVQGSTVYAGGVFQNIYNNNVVIPSADYIAKFDGTDWSALGSNGASDGSLNTGVNALAIQENDLWVGGNFQNVNNNGTSLKNADYLAVFGLPTTPPLVTSITRAGTSPTSAASVNFTVTFSEDVTGVDVDDFTLTKTGSISGESVASVSGSGSAYTVSVNTGSGTGTLRLDVPDTATIQDASAIDLDGLPFTSGQAYTKIISVTYKSTPANDGWILESTETSNTGGTMNSAATTLTLGDDAADKQYRAILHFDTSALPDNAVVTSLTLKIKQQGAVTGVSPFTFASLYVDMRNPAFGGSALELTDFNFAAKKVKSAVFNPNPVSGWFSARFNNGGRLYVNRTGVTQLRLYFSVDDNNNNIADFIRFFSGNASADSRPKLLIQYELP
jgi:hypothetical protein